MLDDLAQRDRLLGRIDRPVVRPGRPPKVDEDGAVPPGKGVTGDLPPWRTTLGDPPPGWVPGGPAAALRDRFGAYLKDANPDRMWFPHLLIRTAAGDRGQRPVWPSTPSWLSPDIWLFRSADVPPGGPVDLSQAVTSPTVGETYTVGIHIWNLGRFPAHGVKVTAWWVEPGFFSGTPDPRYTPHAIGGTWAELGDRESGHAHGIVLIPTTWTIANTGLLHQCLLATVECATDPWSGVLDANHDRHVGQRNLSLIGPADDASAVLAQLGERLDAKVPLRIGAAKAGSASLKGATTRRLSSGKGDGGWPVKAGKARTLATVVRGPAGLDVRLGREKATTVGSLSDALRLALGAPELTGKGLLASQALAGMGQAVVHLSTPENGYTLLVRP